MRALVVYESLFGNTDQVARAIAAGLSQHCDVELVEVAAAPLVITGLVDLLVVGGPTHAFSMTRKSTREDAFARGASHGSKAVGVREWLGRLHNDGRRHSELLATFDTRVDKVRHLPGSAAKAAARLAHRLGFEAATRPESFYVEDVEGPLLDGELERARAWGERLGTIGREPRR